VLLNPPPRQELVVPMALNGRSKNQGPHWHRRVAELTNDAVSSRCAVHELRPVGFAGERL